MTSRERVLAALNHIEPDRVPMDLGGTITSGILAGELHKLRRHLGLEERPVKVYELFQMLGEVELDVVERLQVDVLPVEPPELEFEFGIRREHWKPWRLFDGTEVLVPGRFAVEVGPEGQWLLHQGGDPKAPVVARMPRNGFYFDAVGGMNRADWDPDFVPPPLEEVRRAAWKLTDEDLHFLQERADYLRRYTDKALVLGPWGSTGMGYVGSVPDFLCLLATDKAYVRDLFVLHTELALGNLRRLWEAVGDRVDIIAITGLDLGTQRGEMIAPDVFAELYIPPLKRQFAWVHEHTPWKVWEHCCGSIPRLIPHLVEAGLDALNPVQTSAAGMDPHWLKSTFGDRLTFWGGGVETQTTLAFGTPQEVRQQVRERIRIFAPGGGYVFGPVHNIQYGVPPENIVAAFEAALEFGQYPIPV
ncbi:MAG: uroporphyrinogen decarboxylase family protein [Anaerolineae bacterium]